MNATATETAKDFELASEIAGMMQFAGASPALPVHVSPCWRRTHRFDLSLVHPDGVHQGYFGNCDRVFTRRAADRLSACATYGEQIVCIHLLRREARQAEA